MDSMMTAPSVNDHYAAYKANPSKENLSRVVTGLKPTIDYALAGVNAANDPLVRSKAMVFTAKAIQKYDPKQGAALPTWVSSQLRQLARTARQSRAAVKVPERVQNDAWQLQNAMKQFEDEVGHEPNTLELADYTSMPVRRIEHIRKFAMAIPSESALPLESAATDTAATDWQGEALNMVYHDADWVDRKILEHKTGYGGVQMLPPAQIAAKLKLSPSQLSRRSAKLSLKIHDLQTALEQV